MTLKLIPLAIRRHAQLASLALRAPFERDRRLRGGLLVLAALPIFLLWQVLNASGLLLDELLFRGYRRIRVTAPVFVLGPPRSGTTHLHRVLALDEGTTTFRTWECLFAPSVTARKLIMGLAAVDRRIGRPLSRLARWMGRRLGDRLEHIHALRLDQPEEDFLSLLPIAACFLLVVPLPDARWLWRQARFDREIDGAERAALLHYYRACVQKHLYVHGTDRRFLSKNASFSGMPDALLETFPDARFLLTTRDPVYTLPSQLSALRPALALCGYPAVTLEMRDMMAELLLFYYEHLADFAARHPDRTAVLYSDALRDRLAEVVQAATTRLGIENAPGFKQRLAIAAVASRSFGSLHRYAPEDYALSREDIRSRFATACTRYRFECNAREMPG